MARRAQPPQLKVVQRRLPSGPRRLRLIRRSSAGPPECWNGFGPDGASGIAFPAPEPDQRIRRNPERVVGSADLLFKPAAVQENEPQGLRGKTLMMRYPLSFPMGPAVSHSPSRNRADGVIDDFRLPIFD